MYQSHITDNKDKHNNEKIAGIFNYCDQWCEHCAFTLKCTMYKLKDQPESLDSGSELWDKLSSLYNEIEEPEKDSQIIINRFIYDNRHSANDYNQLKAKKTARKFGSTFKRWLVQNEATFILKTTKGGLTTKQASQCKNALEVIKWYSLFIPLKTNCAMHEYEDELLNQSSFIRGSAKITLIAITRSQQAMAIIREYIPDFQADLLYFRDILNELKSRILIKIPDAMEYVRPGLDEVYKK